MHHILKIISLSALLSTGWLIADEGGNSTAVALMPTGGETRVVERVVTSCLPSTMDETGIYTLKRLFPEKSGETFVALEMNLHIGQNVETGKPVLTYITGYRWNAVPVFDSSEQIEEGRLWSGSEAFLAGLQNLNGYELADQSVRYKVTNHSQVLAVSSFYITCDDSTGTIKWRDNGNLEAGSEGSFQISFVDSKKVLMKGSMTSYYTNGLIYDYVETYLNYALNGWASTGTTYQFKAIPLFGGLVTPPELSIVE